MEGVRHQHTPIRGTASITRRQMRLRQARLPAASCRRLKVVANFKSIEACNPTVSARRVNDQHSLTGRCDPAFALLIALQSAIYRYGIFLSPEPQLYMRLVRWLGLARNRLLYGIPNQVLRSVQALWVHQLDCRPHVALDLIARRPKRHICSSSSSLQPLF